VVSFSTAVLLDIPLHNLPISKYHACFGAGVLAFMLRDRLTEIGSLLPLGVGVGLLILIARMGCPDYFFLAFFPFIVAAVNFRSDNLLARPFILLGDVSYSLYLIHAVLFIIVNAKLGSLQPLPIWLQEPIRWASLLLCIVISIVTWRFIERPMIALGDKLSRRLSPAKTAFGSVG
jgi:peptidoglycan/LPS O-acetylase OafA/YrhL